MWIRRSIGVLFLGFALMAQQTPVNPRTQVDITGAAATVAIAAVGGAEWVQINAPTGNASVVRWGDASTTSTRGGIIAAGGAQFLPKIPGRTYQLPNIYVYVAMSDKVSVVWAN